MIQQLQMVYIVIVMLVLKPEVIQAGKSTIARRGCQDTCGNVSIPFPFGIGSGCFLDSWFKIDCNSTGPTSNGFQFKPFLSKLGIEVIRIKAENSSRSLTVRMPPLSVCSADSQKQTLRSADFSGTPYEYSRRNVFVLQGCTGTADVVYNTTDVWVRAECATVCHTTNSRMPTNNCFGVRCCQKRPFWSSSSLKSLDFYDIEFNLGVGVGQNQHCLAATFVSNDYVEKFSTSDTFSVAPVELRWTWTSKEQPDDDPNAKCVPHDDNSTYCECEFGYYGNPYVKNGCKVANYCKFCPGECHKHLVFGADDLRDDTEYYCERNITVMCGLGIGFGLPPLVFGCYFLHRFIKRRREMHKRANFFKRNGGLLLQQHLLSNQGVVERTKVFTIDELDKATDNFNKNRVLGQGGQGTVYKGMVSDGSIVAIKKSIVLDKTQLEQFINEVVILSQINHKSVVSLMGCCLETEVPLLVYEFIPNGTLYQHLHDPNEDFVLNWEMSLRIAAESASAIAYLHSSSSTSNILLDENYRAKVSDFGCSKTFAIDETHLTTLVQGTLGYLDPEYFQTFQFTEKSDVYSFGVVLLELITRKKPIYKTAESKEHKNLVTEFVWFMQNSQLCDILDPDITRDSKEGDLAAIVDLTKRCVSWAGKSRPKMKEVAMTLEMIIKSSSLVAKKKKVTLDRGKKVIIDIDTD